MPARPIYPEKPVDQPPVCSHCGSDDLKKSGHRGKSQRQRYHCHACGRSSYGVRALPRLKCTACGSELRERPFPDGRTGFRCTGCGKSHRSAYDRSPRKKKESSPCRHIITFALDRHARAGLVDYVQATRCTDAQAVRALFRYVLTGNVFPRFSVVSGHASRIVPVPRDPQAAAMPFPNLSRELALKRLDRSRGYRGRGFQTLVMSVGMISVWLDDEAKEGLVYAMRRLNKNHADAARWLLANVRIPGAEPATPIRTTPPPNTRVIASGRRISADLYGTHDPRWDD